MPENLCRHILDVLDVDGFWERNAIRINAYSLTKLVTSFKAGLEKLNVWKIFLSMDAPCSMNVNVFFAE